MMADMLHRLEADPGSRTIGELIQEHAWAVNEILQLRAEFQAFRQRTGLGAGASCAFGLTRTRDPLVLLILNKCFR